MSRDTSSLPDAEIDRQAAEWFGHREVGLTREQEQEFQRWISADPRHAAHYFELDETWSLIGELKDRMPEEPTAVSSMPSFPHRFIREWHLPACAALAAAAVLAFSLRPFSPPATTRHTVDAQHGSMRTLELSDGSIVRLNAATAVTVTLTAAERHVMLERGEAYFSVAKDPSRPFVVSARHLTVRAVGTAFNVALKSSQLEVLVTEGKVEIDGKAGNAARRSTPAEVGPVLQAGQKAIVALGLPSTQPTRVVSVAASEAERELAWQVKLLEFDEQPLRHVVEEFNRYNQHQLIIADPLLARRTFGGKFRADNYEALIELLGTRFGVIAERSGQQT